MTVPDRIPRRHRAVHAEKDRIQQLRVQRGDVDRMLGTDCHPVHTLITDRGPIVFSLHALQAWLKRVDYRPSTQWHGVNELDKMLKRGWSLVREPPAAILPLSLWAHATNRYYLCVQDGCFPIQTNPNRRLVATTYLAYKETR